jgi:hypothetical protein
MNTNAKPLSISESKAQKALSDAINEIISKKVVVDLLPTDWTLEKLMNMGMSKAQARTTINDMVEKGLAVEIRYRRGDNGYYAKGCRAKE